MPNVLTGPNAIAPDQMTAEARLAEIGRLLAAGFLRYQNGDICLDFSPQKSGLGHEPRSLVGG